MALVPLKDMFVNPNPPISVYGVSLVLYMQHQVIILLCVFRVALFSFSTQLYWVLLCDNV